MTHESKEDVANAKDESLGTKESRRSNKLEDGMGQITQLFVQEIDSLAETLPLANLSIESAYKRAQEQVHAFVEAQSDRREDADGKVTIRIRPDDYLKFNSIFRKQQRSGAARALIPRSFLVALVSQYDAFLGRLIRSLLIARPEILNGSERTLSFSDLMAFENLDAARDQIMEKEIESVLRKSHTEQFEWLENKFSVKLRQELPIWPAFIEVTERRNLCVHAGARVSAQYIQTCRTVHVNLEGIGIGQVLPVSRSYFKKAYETIFEVGLKLAHVLWRKLKPDERSDADKNLISITYDLLAEEKYGLAKTLLDFATDTLKKHASAQDRLILIINRIQAYKWSGDEKVARELLAKEDFSASNDLFKLAEAVLLDDVQLAISIMRRIGKGGTGTLGHYQDWPLFREMRKRPEFEAAVFEIFGERLSAVIVPASETPSSGDGKPSACESSEEKPQLLDPESPVPKID